jgi:hypothetical protein
VVITLGSRRVLGIAYGDMLEVEIELEAEGQAWPDGEWLTLFREYAKFPSDLEEPRLEHGKLRFEVHEAELQRAWKAIKERVHATISWAIASSPATGDFDTACSGPSPLRPG